MNYQIKIFSLLFVLISTQRVLSQEQETKKRMHTASAAIELDVLKNDVFPTSLPKEVRNIIFRLVGTTIIRTFDHTELAEQSGRSIAAMDSIRDKDGYVVSIVGPDEVTRTFDLATGTCLWQTPNNHNWFSVDESHRTKAMVLHKISKSHGRSDLVAVMGSENGSCGSLKTLNIKCSSFQNEASTPAPVTSLAVSYYRHPAHTGLARAGGLMDGSLEHDLDCERGTLYAHHMKKQKHTSPIKQVAFATNEYDQLLRGSLSDDGTLLIGNIDSDTDKPLIVPVPGFSRIESFAFTQCDDDSIEIVACGIADGGARWMKIFNGIGDRYLNFSYPAYTCPLPCLITFIKNEKYEVIGITNKDGRIKQVWDRKNAFYCKDLIEPACPLSCDIDKIRFSLDASGKKRVITGDTNKIEVWGEFDAAPFSDVSDDVTKNIVTVTPKPQEDSCVIM